MCNSEQFLQPSSASISSDAGGCSFCCSGVRDASGKGYARRLCIAICRLLSELRMRVAIARSWRLYGVLERGWPCPIR